MRARASEAFIKTYGIIHPAEQYESDRGVRWAPMAESQKALGAVFYETVGWERPWWYESNADLVEKYGDAVMPREHEWDSRWWSPIINAEHLAMRENAGVIDLTAFSIFDITGPGALASVQQTCVAQCDVAVGKVIYTPVLDAKGGFLSDLTVMRLGEDHFRVVTGGAHGRADLQWFTNHLADGAELHDSTEEISTIGLWGPRARDILGVADRRRRVRRRLRLPELPGDRGQGRGQPRPRLPDLLRRRARLGALRAVRAGRPAVGRRARGRQGPRRRARRHRRLRHHRSPGEGLPRVRRRARRRAHASSRPAMQRPKVKAADFVGRDAYLAQREAAPAAVLCTLTVDDHTSASGVKRYMLGGEPILTPRRRHADRRARAPPLRHLGRLGARRSASTCCSPTCRPTRRTIGNQLAVSYMEELYPVTVGSVDATPLLDPGNERIR